MSKKFSAHTAPKSSFPPEVRYWLEASQPEDRTTLIIRIPSHCDPSSIAEKLSQIGVETESVGTNVITGSIAKKDVLLLLDVKEVLGVEMPQNLSMKSDDDKSNLSFGKRPSRSGYRLPE